MNINLKRATKKIIKTAVLTVFSAYIILFYRCPIKLITGKDCPGCGMTRAIIAALRFDFSAAFSYHPLFWLIESELIFLFVYGIIFDKKIKPIIAVAMTAVTILLLFAVWLYKVY